MKLFLVLLALFVGYVLTGRVQRQIENCSLGKHVGKRCVGIEYCAPKFPDQNPCSDFEDLFYTCTPEDNCNPVAFIPRLSIDERFDQAENATCTEHGHRCCHEDNVLDFGASSKTNNDPPTNKDPLCVHEDQICCPEDQIQQPTTKTFGCNEKKADGYDCYTRDECDETTIDTFGFCGRRSLGNICCIKNEPDATCKIHQDRGFQCVPSNSCTEAAFVPLQSPPVLTCENSGHTCCPPHNIRLPCEDFDDEGFSCIRKKQCLDPMFPDVKDSIQAKGKCGRKRCCKYEKPEEEVRGSCSGNEYSCNQVPKCKLDRPFLKSESTDLLYLTGGSFEIDNGINLCDKDDEVCCVPSTVSPPPPGGPGGDPHIIVTNEPRQCGVRNPNGLTTKAKNPQDGDTSTKFGEWTFTCVMYTKRGSRLDAIVGGATLIAPGVLVTVAHKIIDNDFEPQDLLVKCGEWDVSRDEDEEVYPSQSRNVESISLHPLYSEDAEDLANDIAILHVTEDFILADHLGVACLPNDNQEESNFEHNDCVFMGWGSRADPKTDFTATANFQPILEAFHDNPIVKKDECEEKARNTNWPENAAYVRPDSIICAGGNGADPCKGDAGGPLVCPLREEGEETRYVLAGVVAGVLPGGQCGTSNLPAAYASVANNICFIHWATKCKSKENYKQYFWYPQCDNWIEDAKEEVKDYGDYDDYFDDLEDSCI